MNRPQYVCVYPQFLSTEECDYLRSMWSNPARIDVSKTDLRQNCNAEICWLWNSRQQTRAIRNRLFELACLANRLNFKFDPALRPESLVVSAYRKVGSQRVWHSDGGYSPTSRTNKYRKLTVVVQLSYPWEYLGSDLQFLSGHEPKKCTKGIGTAIVFSSYEPHQVTPLDSGYRFSASLFVTGTKPFR